MSTLKITLDLLSARWGKNDCRRLTRNLMLTHLPVRRRRRLEGEKKRVGKGCSLDETNAISSALPFTV